MKKVRFSEEQMVGILREADRGTVTEVAKKHAVSDQVWMHLVIQRWIAREQL
ncbi:MAG: hypothetical protein K0U98_25760 [Deltaproteobacteria bacterium]|nr:hypothetical protein [Deltaproteobacteria bacterium]